MPEREEQKKPAPSVPTVPFVIHPEIGEAIDDVVTPIMRPTLVLGRDHVYHTEYELTELKRKLKNKNSLPMPANCVGFLESVLKRVEGTISEDAFQASLNHLPARELDEVISYCIRQKWLNSWNGVLQLTYDGVKELADQLAFDSVAGRASGATAAGNVPVERPWQHSRIGGVPLRGWDEILTHLQLENNRARRENLKRLNSSTEGPIGWCGDIPEVDPGELKAWIEDTQARNEVIKRLRRDADVAREDLGEREGARAADYGAHIDQRHTSQ